MTHGEDNDMESTLDATIRAEETAGATFTESELARLTGYVETLRTIDRSVIRHLGHADSKRGKRRALALLIGHEYDGVVSVWRLRDACRREGIYETRGDRANFTQDMRKDGERGLWTVHTYKAGSRELGGHWKLTESGAHLASRYHEAVAHVEERNREIKARNKKIVAAREIIVNVHRSVAKTIVVSAKAPRCPYCREDIVPTDRAKCDECGSEAHAGCLRAFGARRCVLANTTAQCDGSYKVIAKPEAVEDDDDDDTCSRCNGLGVTFRAHLACQISDDTLKLFSGAALAALEADRAIACEKEGEFGSCRSHSAHTAEVPCSSCASKSN